jgi:hypothetical protein
MTLHLEGLQLLSDVAMLIRKCINGDYNTGMAIDKLAPKWLRK